MKKMLSFIMIFILLVGTLSLPAYAEEQEEEEVPVVSILTQAQFLSFARNCVLESYSAGVRFVLKTDLDLSGTDFEPIPYFAGSFDGEKHLIQGLNLSGDGSRQGLFRELGPDAVLRELRVEGQVKPGGSQCDVGGIVGLNNGLIESCSFSGTVEGIENVGGIAGRNGASGSIVGGRFDGSILGEHQVGGVAGKNEGILLRCASSGRINAVAFTPQGENRFDLASFSQDEFLDLTNIGGISGENTGIISVCTNTGDVGYKYTGYNVGGIAGKSSGYLDSCANSGSIEGRRDVGGIAGQLIPYAAWDFSNGRLDALSNEINGMNYLIAEAAKNAGDKSSELYGQLGTMNAYTADALNALTDIMRTYAENDQNIISSIRYNSESGQIEFPDLHLNTVDTGGLTAALNNMYAQTTVLAGMLGNTVTGAVNDLSRITSQMSRIFDVLFSMVSDAPSGDLITTRDLSFEECYDHDEGAISACRNRGSVRADTDAGGIVGAVAFEISFDMEDQLNASSFLTSNAEQYLFAAVRGCESSSRVQTRADNAGGIAGRMDVGAIVDCIGVGSVASQNGSYVGGIAGVCRGTVSACWSRSELSADRYAGGIAGLGTDLLDCRAWVRIENASEYSGAVAGWAEGIVSGNLYAEGRPAGVDDVSRTGQADPIRSDLLLQLDGAPDGLDQLTVRFLANGRIVRVDKIPFGSGVKELPAVPNDGARFWQWEDFDREHIYTSMDISGEYRSPATTLSSGGEIPLFLVEGLFYEGQTLRAEKLGDEPEAYTIEVEGYEGPLTVRMQTEDRLVYEIGEGGVTEAISAEQDGQYLVFTLPNGGSFLLMERPHPAVWPMALCFGLAAAVLIVGTVLLIRRRKTPAPPISEEQEP